MNAFFRPVQTQKIEKGTDPKSVVCAYFKAANCGKGEKCKFSHDLSVERNTFGSNWANETPSFRMNEPKKSCYIPSDRNLFLEGFSSSSGGVGSSAVTDQNAKDQSKRLKFNSHPSSEFLCNQGYASTHENSTPNEILAPYTNYQTFACECNNAAASSSTNNLSNQTNTCQYTQPKSYNHQPQQPQSACYPIGSTNYLQAPVSLSSYKSSHSNEMTPKNQSASTRQSFLHPFKNHHHQIE